MGPDVEQPRPCYGVAAGLTSSAPCPPVTGNP
jgi:hypothetical protein